jgi:hypothetical protein
MNNLQFRSILRAKGANELTIENLSLFINKLGPKLFEQYRDVGAVPDVYHHFLAKFNNSSIWPTIEPYVKIQAHSIRCSIQNRINEYHRIANKDLFYDRVEAPIAVIRRKRPREYDN